MWTTRNASGEVIENKEAGIGRRGWAAAPRCVGCVTMTQSNPMGAVQVCLAGLLATAAFAFQADESFVVTGEHPLLLLRPQRIRLLRRERERRSARWQQFEALMAGHAAMPEQGFALALYYQVAGEAGAGRRAIEWALTSGDDLRQLALGVGLVSARTPRAGVGRARRQARAGTGTAAAHNDYFRGPLARPGRDGSGRSRTGCLRAGAAKPGAEVVAGRDRSCGQAGAKCHPAGRNLRPVRDAPCGSRQSEHRPARIAPRVLRATASLSTCSATTPPRIRRRRTNSASRP